MKNLIWLILAMALLSSCGLQNQINELKNREAQAEIDSQTRDAILQDQISNLGMYIVSIKMQLKNVDADMKSNSLAISQLSENALAYINNLQAQQSLLMTQLATLQGYTNIVSVKNPCGVQAANEEVFLQLSNGKYLASFSENANGKNTRFALLSDGNFVTSDGTQCFFSVSDAGTVINNEHN